MILALLTGCQSGENAVNTVNSNEKMEGMEQTEVNSQKYLRCKVGDKKIFNGILEITVPEETGQYTLTAWVVKDPFSESFSEYFPLSSAPGFTIDVCE